MKILQLIQKSQLRGAEIFACQLSNQLLLQGHDVKMVCLHDGDAILPFDGELIGLNRALSNRFIDVKGWQLLAEEITRFRPDIVQANAGDTLKFAVLSKAYFRWNIPIIFRNANKVSDFLKSVPKKWFNRFLFSRVQHVISVSELCRQDFVNTYSYALDKISMVPIGIDIKKIIEDVPLDLTDIYNNYKVLVNVGSLVPEKNQMGLLNIIKEVIRADANVKLIIVGDGKQRDTIKEKINVEGLNDHVFLAGFRTDVLSIMKNAKALVLPSLIEGLPGVILEAQYCSIPVIAYDVGGISEIICKNRTGWLVDKGDEKQFVNAIHDSLRDKLQTKVIVENAYQQVISDYDNEQIAQRFIAVYERVLKRNG